MDRGYNDYALFGRWTMAEVYFVTRLKDNAAYEVVEECQVPANPHFSHGSQEGRFRLAGCSIRGGFNPNGVRRCRR